LRTRVSFELAMRQLGGQSLYLSPAEIGLGKRESVPDVSRVLSRFADVIAARTFSHQTVVAMAKYTTIPVINALSDFEHPCQAIADMITIQEHKCRLKGINLTYLGDGNNVAHSLMLAAAQSGMNFTIAAPKGYEVNEGVLKKTREFAKENDASVFCTEDPTEAVRGADVIYTDVWTSMGQEEEAQKRRKIFADYQLNEKLVALADKNAILMHCLPAHYGDEVSETILETPQSVIFDQAENRLHAQKAILAALLGRCV